MTWGPAHVVWRPKIGLFRLLGRPFDRLRDRLKGHPSSRPALRHAQGPATSPGPSASSGTGRRHHGPVLRQAQGPAPIIPALRQAQGPAAGPVLRQAQQPGLPLQHQPIHIRIPLLKAKREIKGVGLHAGGLGGEAKVNGSEFVFGEVADSLQERTPDPLAAVGRKDHDVLDTRLAAGRGLEDAKGGAADDVLLVVLGDENARARRRHRTLLLQRSHRYFRVQLLHQAQQILDLGSCQCAKFKVSHSILKKGYVNYVNPSGPSAGSGTVPSLFRPALRQAQGPSIPHSVRPFDRLRDRPPSQSGPSTSSETSSGPPFNRLRDRLRSGASTSWRIRTKLTPLFRT